MDSSSTITRSISVDGRTVRASAAAQLEPRLDELLEILSEHAEKLRDGFSVWYGWGPIVLRECEHGSDVVLSSPDYSTDPRTRITDDLTLAIGTIVNMAAVLNEADVLGADIEFTDDLICVIGWENSDMLQLSRIETTTPGDSGWFIEPFPSERTEEWATEELVRLPAWRVVQLRPAVARVLELPVGIAAIIEGDGVRAVIRQSDREVLATNL